MNNKDNRFSTVKAIGIILMVIGHSGCPDYLHRLIYYFHMPLFFFCSGFFYVKPITFNDCAVAIRKKIKGLYFPYLKWSLCFLFLHNIFFRIGLYNGYYGYEGHVFNSYSFTDFLKRIAYIVFTMDKHEPLLGGFWFLKVLLLSSIIVVVCTYIMRRYSTRWTVLIFIVALFISKYFSFSLPFVGNLSVIIMGALFFLFGYEYKKIENVFFYKWSLVIALSACLIVFSISSYSISMFCSFSETFLYLPLALIGILSTFALSYKLDAYKWRLALYEIGQYTLKILALHFLAFKAVSLFLIQYKSLPIERLSELPVILFENDKTCFVYSFVGVLLPILVTKLFKRAYILFIKN